MYFKLLQNTRLVDTPSTSGTPAGDVFAGSVGRMLEKDGDNWVKLLFRLDGSAPVRGWARRKSGSTDRLEEVQPKADQDVNLWAFVKGCVDAEFWINKQDDEDQRQFFVTADYMLAWANIETNNQVTRPIQENSPPTDGTGPFQLSSTEWETFTSDPLGADYNEDYRFSPLDQIAGAAFVARKAMMDISAAIDAHDRETGHDDGNKKIEPYVPSYIDVLLAHMFGTQFAVKCRIYKFDNQAGKSVKDVLEELYSAADAAQYLDDRSKFTKDWDTDEVETIDGMYLNTNETLTKAFQKAFEQIKQEAPEDAAAEYKDGEASWYTTAQAQHTEWESTLGDENTVAGKARIREYFGAIDYALGTGKLPAWCGAFAGYCVKEATGNLQNVKGPARAANWVTFGNTQIDIGDPEPPVGAIVVLSPDSGSASSGHVGCFVRYSGSNNDQVFLLGGNQSNTVQISKFARSKIRTIRWASPKKATEDGAATGPLAPLLDFIGELESNNNYNAYFANANNTDNPVLVTKTINEALVFMKGLAKKNGVSSASGKYQFIQRTLRGLRDSGKISGSDLFNQANQDKLAIDLLNGRGLKAYLGRTLSENQFGINLAKEWASLPVPVDTQGAHRKVAKGESYYAGDGVNKSLSKVADFRAAMQAIKS